MNNLDTYRYLVGGYYGVMEMDEYTSKEYILKDIEEYIKYFISETPVDNYKKEDYINDAEYIKDNVVLKTKLQDALLVLNKINGPIDLIIMIKHKIKDIDKNDL